MFQLVQSCTEWPHNDPLGLQSPKGYVDTGIDSAHADGYLHRLYLSETVVQEAARLFGYASPAEAKSLRAAVETARAEGYAAGLEAAVAQITRQAEALTAA